MIKTRGKVLLVNVAKAANPNTRTNNFVKRVSFIIETSIRHHTIA